MIWLQIMVTTATIVAISAGLPQILRLIRLKSSVEFNLGTWVMWVAAQIIFISYAASIGDTLLIVVNSCWAVFYSLMVMLIIYYRPRPVPVQITAEETASSIRQ